MAQFCTCGSIMINNHCTNKNCSNKSEHTSASARTTKARKTTNDASKIAKPAKTRRASKCITYNLYDIKDENQA